MRVNDGSDPGKTWPVTARVFAIMPLVSKEEVVRIAINTQRRFCSTSWGPSLPPELTH